jgi:peroxiredoxin
MIRLLWAGLVAVCILPATDTEVEKAALRLDLVAAKAPRALAMEFRMRAAESLQAKHPELARKLVDQTLAELRSGKDWVVGEGVIQSLAQLSPSDALSVLMNLVPGYEQIVISALVQSGSTDRAAALYVDLLKQHRARAAGASSLLGPMAKQNPAQATKLFSDVLATLPDPLDPADAAWIVNTAAIVATFAPEAAAGALEQVLKAASLPDYGANSNPMMLGAFTAGSKPVNTTNTRDTMLLAAAVRLRALAPDRLPKYREALSRWDVSGPLQLKSIYRSSPPAMPADETRVLNNSITQRMGQIRGKATDAERGELVRQIAKDIDSLPPGTGKVSNIRTLAGYSTEGDLGKETLTAVGATLAGAIRDSYPVMFAAKSAYPYGEPYIELAKFVRYEGIAAPFPDPALDAAGALLELRERILQESGFTLTGLDGKRYTLADLKGRVVMLNFWATWCPPCRKEMPDMEKLSIELESKGLTILAVSNEDRETVERFLAKTPYSFPVLLDPGGKVHATFQANAIPKTFIFDREGRLAAQAIDMRTESQFRELLKRTGL